LKRRLLTCLLSAAVILESVSLPAYASAADMVQDETETEIAATDEYVNDAAEAEAEANRLRTQALTPAVLQKAWIDKWDGSVPTVNTSENNHTFLDISKFK
jgi:hypothetical protein